MKSSNRSFSSRNTIFETTLKAIISPNKAAESFIPDKTATDFVAFSLYRIHPLSPSFFRMSIFELDLIPMYSRDECLILFHSVSSSELSSMTLSLSAFSKRWQKNLIELQINSHFAPSTRLLYLWYKARERCENIIVILMIAKALLLISSVKHELRAATIDGKNVTDEQREEERII